MVDELSGGRGGASPTAPEKADIDGGHLDEKLSRENKGLMEENR